MRCEFCGFANGDDEHRCLRCGRRTTGHTMAPIVGNTALAMDDWEREAPLLSSPPLSAQKVIPFTEIQRQAGITPLPPPPPSVATPPSRPVPPQAQPQAKRRAQQGPVAEQGKLELTPMISTPAKTLTNGILAANSCPLPVAGTSHRLSAGVIDFGVLLIGFGLFAGTIELAGYVLEIPHILGTGKPFLMTVAGIFFAVSVLYSAIWLLSRRETIGMHMLGLELVTFEGRSLEFGTRLIRIATTWLSLGAGGLGVIWAIADEEKLTWQDHISKSFPTFRETNESFVREKR